MSVPVLLCGFGFADVCSLGRNDSSKSLTTTGRPASSLSPSSAGITSLSLSHASTQRSSLLRLTVTETTELEANVETLRDLFWTLFSKLDAVLQGFRVMYEVAGRIAEVSSLV